MLTSQDAGNAGRAVSDEDVLSFAIAQNRAVGTLNRLHFIRLHLRRPDHPGIIVCTYDPDFAALARRINAAIGTAVLLSGKLIRVNRAA